jgi:Flp pilus assembly protein protease CpaA
MTKMQPGESLIRFTEFATAVIAGVLAVGILVYDQVGCVCDAAQPQNLDQEKGVGIDRLPYATPKSMGAIGYMPLDHCCTAPSGPVGTWE